MKLTLPIAVLSAMLVLAVACRQAEEPAAEPAPALVSAGSEAYRVNACGICHGREREGTELGPPLRNLARFWSAERLQAFLKEPESFRTSSERMAQLAELYPADMPGLPAATAEELTALAAYLLATDPL